MCLIILNPGANSGKGMLKWRRLETKLRDLLNDPAVVMPTAVQEMHHIITHALHHGERAFVAAGGDGTVNLAVDALMKATTATARNAITFGAIGLGSSNDFHKPFAPDHMLESVPIHIDSANTSYRDVGRVRYRDETGHWHSRHFIINASIGVTAFANHLYNSGDALIEWLQKRSAGIAIVWAALRTIAQYRNIPATMRLNGMPPLRITVTNLGVIKNPHFAGNFCYDTPITPDSGDFCVNLCENMSLVERLKILHRLAHHHFTGCSKTRSWRTAHVHLRTEQPIPLETDGEIVMTNEARFDIINQALRVCQ